jgi:glycosyltransferase involved in cell wall biosynthesis
MIPNNGNNRVLVSTILPWAGGVPAKRSVAIRWLRERGYEPVIAYYAPYSLTPDLSVPSWKLLQRRPRSVRVDDVDGCETHAMGAWLPELEFTHYSPSAAWKRLIDSCAYHIGICGSVHPLAVFHKSGKPYLGWVGTGWEEDIRSRGIRFSRTRRFLEKRIVIPRMMALERQILQSGTILAVSQHTKTVLDGIAGEPVIRAVLSMPIDSEYFRPAPERIDEQLIGFSGRLTDPRKNLPLLLQSVAYLKQEGSPASLALVGDELDSRTAALIDELGITDRVQLLRFMPRDDLARTLQTFDVYVVPSHQEGLCIAALEAMASGTPVVSTRCGGPMEYVIDDETGYLVDFDPRMMADRIHRILSDRAHRKSLSANARSLIETRYSLDNARKIFWEAFEQCFQNSRT